MRGTQSIAPVSAPVAIDRNAAGNFFLSQPAAGDEGIFPIAYTESVGSVVLFRGSKVN